MAEPGEEAIGNQDVDSNLTADQVIRNGVTIIEA
jgi:hypothetical protein